MFGAMVSVAAPPGLPDITITLYWPSEREPLPVVKVLEVLLRVISRTPLVKRSTMLKLLLVVVPHVPDCSPFLISSSPVFGAYVLAI